MFTKTLKHFDKLRDKQNNSSDYLSLYISGSSLTIKLLASPGLLITKSFDLCEEVTQSPTRFVSSLSPLIKFDCNNNDSMVEIIIQDNRLIISDMVIGTQVVSNLYPTEKYYIDSIVIPSDNKYFKLDDIKKVLQGLTVKEHGEHICVNIIDNCMNLKTNLVDIKLMRTK